MVRIFDPSIPELHQLSGAELTILEAPDGHTHNTKVDTIAKYALAQPLLTQALDRKQDKSATLSALAELAVSVFGEEFLTLVDAAAVRRKLQLGNLATKDAIAFTDLSSHPTSISEYGITDAPILAGDKIPTKYLPEHYGTSHYSAASQAEMLALQAVPSESCIRTDFTPKRIYTLRDAPATDINNWIDISDQVVVQSVNEQTGLVHLGAADVGADPAGSAEAVNRLLVAHESDTTNPHRVTREQIGAEAAGAAATVNAQLQSHASNTSNPHNVTAAQIGAATPTLVTAAVADLKNTLISSVLAKAVSVLAYGVKPVESGGTAADAYNNSQKINQALAENDLVFVPAGCTIYCLISRATSTLQADDTTKASNYVGIYVPPGKVFLGENKQSSKIIAAPSTNTPSAGCLLIADSNSKVYNLQFDGNRANTKGTGNWSNWLIRVFPQSQNVVFKNLIIKSVASSSSSQESFGLSLFATKNATAIGVEAYDIAGTGIHLDGDYTLSILNTNSKVINCNCRDNDWMGLSAYGASGVTILDSEFSNNKVHGLNFEWTYNPVVSRSKIERNGGAGIGTFGQVVNLIVRDTTVAGNLSDAATTEVAEFSFRSGEWYKPAAGQTTPARGILHSAQIINCDVRPTSKAHVNVEPFIGVPSAGGIPNSYPLLSIPNQILISSPGSENWRYTPDTAEFRQQGLRLKGVTTIPAKSMKNLPDWPVLGGITKANYSGSGAKGRYPQTLTTTALYGAIVQPVEFAKSYLVTFRYLSPGVNNWFFYIYRSSAPSTKSLRSPFANLASDAGNWIETQIIFTVPNDGNADWVLALQSDELTVPSLLVVDYVIVEELLTEKSEVLDFTTALGVFTLKGATTRSELRNTDTSSGGVTFRVDGFPTSSSQSVVLRLGELSPASDFQINVYKPGTSTLIHNISASDSFLAQGPYSTLGVGMGYQVGAESRLTVDGRIRAQGAAYPAFKLAGYTRVKLAADVAINSTSGASATTLSLLSINGVKTVLAANALLVINGRSFTVQAKTTLDPTTPTNVTCWGNANAVIPAGTFSSPFSPYACGDRWTMELDTGTPETGGNSGSSLRFVAWSDTGSDTLAGAGAPVGTLMTLRRDTLTVEIPKAKLGDGSFAQASVIAGIRQWAGTAAPTTGTYQQGDRVQNSAPVAGDVLGWICVASGSPGTWKSYGQIAA